MEKQLITRYFLGANAYSGFYSLYGGFCAGEGDYLRVIKGGPGTGKSALMRRIGAAAHKSTKAPPGPPQTARIPAK